MIAKLVRSASALALAAGLVPGTPVLAQEAAGAADDAAVSEILVTARRRSESLLEVPVAMSALSSERIESAGIEDLRDLSSLAPGFTFSDQAVTGRNDRSFQTGLIIRGMASNSNLSTRQIAQLFLDGAPIPGGGLRSVEDVERIEIIKGPQSAYFGRATFAGAVNIVTRSPSLEEWGGRAFASYGRFDSFELGGAVEGPIVADRLAIRASAQIDDRGGPYRNSAKPDERLGARRTESASLTLRARPADGLEAKAYVLVYRDEDGPPANVLFDARDFNCDAGAGRGRNNWYCGKLPTLPASRIGLNTDISAAFRQNFIDNANGTVGSIFDESFIDRAGLVRKALQSTFRLSYEFAGGASIESLTAYHRDRRQTIADSDLRDTSGLPNPSFGRIPGAAPTINWLSLVSAKDRQFSQELRLTSAQEGAFRWTFGANYSDQDAVGSFPVDSPLGILPGFGINDRSAETTGVFGAAYVDLGERLTLSAEGRYQWDKVSDENRQTRIVLSDTFESFAPRLILDYEASDDLMVYASWAVGYRPGAFNGNIAGLPANILADIERATGAGLSVDEEKLGNYEIGAKGRALDGALQFAIAAYTGRWTNQHVSTSFAFTDPVTNRPRLELVTSAVGRTRVRGIEVETAIRPARVLQLDASFAINDTSIRDYVCSVCQTNITGSPDVRGNRIPLAPKYSAAFAASLDTALTASLDGFARADVVHQGTKYATEANLAETGASTRVNLRVGVETGGLRLEAYVRNLFDDDTYASIDRSLDLAALTFGNAISAALPERRNWGLRASYRF